MTWLDKLTKGAEYVAGGFHSVPLKNENPLKSLPSMHRLLNVVGMVAGFAGAKYIADTIFGQKINGSQYQKIPREKVFPPLRFLHGIVHYNPFSDDPRDQWLKIVHQMIPAAGGAFGAIKGSALFFDSYNGASGRISKMLADNVGKKLHPLDAEQAITYEQGKIWRIGAGLSAWMGSVTGLTGILYGWTLNSAFLLCNEGKSFVGASEATGANVLRKFTNNQYHSSRGPKRALPRLLDQFETFCRKARSDGNTEAAADEFGRQVAGGVVYPFFRKLKPEEKKTIVERIQKIFNEAYHAHEKACTTQLKPLQEKLKYIEEEIAHTPAKSVTKAQTDALEAAQNELKTKQAKEAEDLKKEMTGKVYALLKNPEIQKMGSGMVAGNNGWLGWIAEKFNYSGKIAELRNRMIGYSPSNGGNAL